MVYVLIHIFKTIMVLPISEAFYWTEATADLVKNALGVSFWPSDMVNYTFLVLFTITVVALLLPIIVRRRVIALKDYLKPIITAKEYSQWNERQYERWIKRIDGKWGNSFFILGYVISACILFFWFFPTGTFPPAYIIYHLIDCFFLQGIPFALVFWVGIFCFGTAKQISDLCQENFRINPFHKDTVGGLKPIGGLALLNALTLTIIIVILIFDWIMNNLAGFEDLITIINTYLFTTFGVLASFCIFYYPVRRIHNLLMKIKENETDKVLDSYYNYYIQLNSVPTEDHSKILLNLLGLQSIITVLGNFRDYPWDTKIFIKLFSSYLIPIIVFILNQFYGISL